MDVAAKAFGVGKPAVNQARARLNLALTSPDGRHVAGVSKEALEEAVRVAPDQTALELWVASETPWRLEHAEAKKLFPASHP